MMFPRIPAGVTLCLSSLLACGVLLLQHAEDYANKLEGTLYTWAEEAPALLRQSAAMCGALSWQGLEKEALAAFPAVPYLAGEAPEAAGLDEGTDTPEQGEGLALVPDEPAPGTAVPADLPQQEAGREPGLDSEPGVAVALPGTEDSSAAEFPAEGGDEELCRCVAPAPKEAERISFWERSQSCARLGMEKARLALEMMAEYRRSHPEIAEAATQAEGSESASPPQEPLPPPSKCYVQCRVMMVGDSLMEGLGPVLHRSLMDRKGMEVVVTAKYSTGLCRPDIFDWPATMRQVVSSRRPDLVIFFIGANDGQPIKEGGKFVPTGGKAWRDAYARKMDEMVSIAREQGAGVIWVELPAVGGRYSKLLHENQIAQRDYCAQNGITSLQTDPIFSGVFGKFESYGEYKGRHVRLRTKDLTHLTAEGNKKLVDNLMPLIDEKLTEFYQKHPEKRLTDEQAAKWKRVQAFYTIKYEPPKRRRK